MGRYKKLGNVGHRKRRGVSKEPMYQAQQPFMAVIIK